MPALAARAAQLLAEAGAIITGSHIVYTSGRHGSAYVNKDAVYPETSRVRELCALLAEGARELGVEVVCGPAMGGIILAQWTAHHLGCLAVYAEPTPEGGMTLRRGYDRLACARRVLVVEDVVNTGGSLRSAVAAVRAAGGEVVGAAALCNRGGVRAQDLGVAHLASLVELPLDSFEAAACPLCREGVPVNTDLGKGREFLARAHGARAGTPRPGKRVV